MDVDYFRFRHNDVKTNVSGLQLPTAHPARPKLCTLGREVNIGLNTFNVLSYPTKPVYQYDVSITGITFPVLASLT